MRQKYILGTPSERFWPKVVVAGPDDCWLWQGATARGYGSFRLIGGSGGKTVDAHRFAYEDRIGPIPAGLVIDHLCRVPLCVNPAHLEPVTQRENCLIRGMGAKAVSYRTGVCGRGHSLEDAHRDAKGRVRNCRQCRLEKRRAGEWK